MTNSINTTVIEVTKNIHDSYNGPKLSWQRHWQVMMLWFMSRCHLKQCHICIQNVIIEWKTLNDSCHTHS